MNPGASKSPTGAYPPYPPAVPSPSPSETRRRVPAPPAPPEDARARRLASRRRRVATRLESRADAPRPPYRACSAKFVPSTLEFLFLVRAVAFEIVAVGGERGASLRTASAAVCTICREASRWTPPRRGPRRRRGRCPRGRRRRRGRRVPWRRRGVPPAVAEGPADWGGGTGGGGRRRSARAGRRDGRGGGRGPPEGRRGAR